MFCVSLKCIVYSLKAGRGSFAAIRASNLSPLTSYPLIRNSRCIITRVDGATTCELGLLDKMNHSLIVLVRINANIGALR